MSPRIYFFRSSACSTRTPRHRRGLHIGVTHARTRTHARAHTQFAGADSAALRHRDAGVHARAHQVAVWMSSVHACIERLIRHYAIRKARLHPTTPPAPHSPCNHFPRSPQQRGHCAPSLLHPLPVSYPQGEHLAPSSPLLPLDPISPHTLWELSIPKVSPHYPTRTRIPSFPAVTH